MVNWTSGYIQAGPLKMHYQRAGHGQHVIMAHGFSDAGSCWKAYANTLAAHYDVILIDARGHGKSSNPGEHYTPQDQAADVRALISQLHLAHPFLIGHSMGAWMALAAASSYPAALRGVVLEDPPLFLDAPQPPVVKTKTDDDAESVIPAMHSWIMGIKAMSHHDLVVRAIQENPTWRAEEILPWVESKEQFDPNRPADDPARMVPWQTQMAHVGVPTLIVCGDTTKGALVSAAAAAAARGLSPLVEVALIRDTGHCIRRDAPDAYAALVTDFLRRHKEK